MSMEDLCWCWSISKCFLREDGVSSDGAVPGEVAEVISELLKAVPLSVPEST